MKISLNMKFIDGPYGGGMQFAKYLKDFLVEKKYFVTNDLKDDDIDIILHINPFPFKSRTSAYSFFSAYAYKLRHPNTVIILRINECDERKNTTFMNRLLVQASRYCDCVVYIASWLRPIMEKSGLNKIKPASVILNGADENIFNLKNKEKWDGKSPLKIVTHHWGANFAKGHDIYKKLDDLLAREDLQNKYAFTFIGNYPPYIDYKNTKLIPPLYGKELAKELKKHDVYLTASKNEPAGMHHIEGALCGLPLLYIHSGALPEYCQGYGIEFNLNDFEKKLDEIYGDYDVWFEKIKAYGNTAQKMAEKYHELFSKAYAEKEKFKLKKSAFIRLLESYAIKGYSIFYFIYWKFKITILL